MKLPFIRSRGLSVKFALAITAVVAGVAFTIGAVTITLDWQRFQRELEDRALLFAHSVAITAPEAILRNDYWFLFKSLKKISAKAPEKVKTAPIITGMVLDPTGKVLAHLHPSKNPLGLRLRNANKTEERLTKTALSVVSPAVLEGDYLNVGFVEGVAPIYSDEVLLGVVRIRLSREELYLKAQRSTFIVFGITLALVVLGSLLGAAISQRITSPLTTMAEGMEAVGRGEYSNVAPVQVHQDDELGDLAQTFNKMAEDLADKKQLEEQMTVSEKLVALGRITAGVAHEVNNPLAGLINLIDTLKNHPGDMLLMARYVPQLEKGLNRIKGIVQSLLIELRVEEAQDSNDPSFLEDVKEIVEAEIDNRNINFIWENHLNDNIRLNGRRVQQVVHNLLKNAIQAIPVNGTVSFLCFQDGDCVVIEVSDNGPGIPPEIRSQLFDPFFTTKPNGTGLGLWIVYRLVESMRGVIEVESEVGSGTVFQVTLPANESTHYEDNSQHGHAATG